MDTKPPETAPGELVIATSADRVLVRIQKDGTIIYGPDYTPDEAAQVLWQAIARQRKESEVRELLFQQIEHLLTKLGEQDLRYERCQFAARAPGATEHERFHEERAAKEFEMLVHQVVELARGLALSKRQHEPSTPPPPSNLN